MSDERIPGDEDLFDTRLDKPKCPFSRTRVCPHKLYKNNPAWCQVCCLVELMKTIDRLRLTGLQP